MKTEIDCERIENSSEISAKNKELFKKFLEHMKVVKEVSDLRIKKYKGELKRIGEWIDFDLDKADKEDIKSLVAKIKSNGYSEWTEHDYKVCIKKFYKEIFGEEEGGEKKYPEEVAWINTNYSGGNGGIQLPDELLEPEDIKAMINAAQNPRDKCLVHILYDSGARLNEIRDVQLKDIDFNGKSVDVKFKTLKSDKGPRTLSLVPSAGAIKDWIEEHPKKQDKNAYLFCNIGNKRRGEKIGVRNIYHILDRVAKHANVDKAHNPHAFRHACASSKSQWMTEAQMNYWLGWKMGSDMPAVYIHLSGDKVNDAVKGHHGVKGSKEVKSEMDSQTCPRCGEEGISPTLFVKSKASLKSSKSNSLFK